MNELYNLYPFREIRGSSPAVYSPGDTPAVIHVTLVQRGTGHLFHISLRKNLECARLSNHCDFFASRRVPVVTGVWQVRMACAMPVCVLFVFQVGYRF